MTESILRKSCGRVEFDIKITEPSCSHTNEKSPCTVVRQTNVTFSNTLAVMMLGLIVTVIGDAKRRKKYSTYVL